MVAASGITAQVCVAGKPLTELLSPSGEAWVVARFDTPVTFMAEPVEEEDPFGEKYSQSWPVTPFTVRVTNSRPDAVLAHVYVDGRYQASRMVLPNSQSDITGPKVGDDINKVAPMLFTVPRRVCGGQEPAAQPETIQVKFCKVDRMETRTYRPPACSACVAVSAGISKDQAKTTSAAATVMIGQQTKTDSYEAGKSYVHGYAGQALSSVYIKYSTQQKLESMGLLP